MVRSFWCECLYGGNTWEAWNGQRPVRRDPKSHHLIIYARKEENESSPSHPKQQALHHTKLYHLLLIKVSSTTSSWISVPPILTLLDLAWCFHTTLISEWTPLERSLCVCLTAWLVVTHFRWVSSVGKLEKKKVWKITIIMPWLTVFNFGICFWESYLKGFDPL